MRPAGNAGRFGQRHGFQRAFVLETGAAHADQSFGIAGCGLHARSPIKEKAPARAAIASLGLAQPRA
jgi:hypothetical protein